ncbi:lytic transglycosylase domain-containing protein [Ktedonobacteria bacterium brp13]|nr:lytic transglycosylase domain-containing protein [Ktedonobacteria bacterium brp13]
MMKGLTSKPDLYSALGGRVVLIPMAIIVFIASLSHFGVISIPSSSSATTTTTTTTTTASIAGNGYAEVGQGTWDVVETAENMAQQLTTNNAGQVTVLISHVANWLQPYIGNFANPDNVQCAEFVHTVFQLSHPAGKTDIDHSLPWYGNAIDYWSNVIPYESQGWQRIDNGTEKPLPGDMVVWDGGDQGLGHVAIVVAVNSDSIDVANANAPGGDGPGKLYRRIPMDGNGYLTSNYTGESILGLIRNQNWLTNKDTSGVNTFTIPASLQNSPWIDVARQDANDYNIDSNIFLRQIYQESGFNPDTPNSSTGAQGIAQFMPGTGAECGVVTAADREDPTTALKGAACLDAENLQLYITAKDGQPDTLAYEKMLAAYNAGPGAVGSGSDWFSKLPAETQNYITVIIGSTNLV